MWQYESHILQNLNLHFGVKSSDLCNINLWPLAVLQAINLWPQANLTEGKSHPVDNKREVCLGLSTHCNGCLVCVNFTDAARNEWERKSLERRKNDQQKLHCSVLPACRKTMALFFHLSFAARLSHQRDQQLKAKPSTS